MNGIRTTLKVAIAAVAVVIVLVMAAVVALSFIDIDEYKQFVIQQVKSQTGRDLSIDKLRFEWGWTPVLVLEKVTLKDSDSSRQQPMIEIEALRARMKLRSLLSGDIEFESLIATAPTIRLTVDRDGRANWNFTDGGKQAEPEDQGNFEFLVLSRLTLVNLHIENAQLHYNNQKTEQSLSVGMTKFYAWKHWLDNRRGLDIEAVVGQRKLRLTGRIDSVNKLLIGNQSKVDIDLRFDQRTHLAFHGILGGLLTSPEVNLDVNVVTDSLTRTLDLVGIENQYPDGSMKLKTRILSSQENLMLSDLTASMETSYGDISINGEITKFVPEVDGRITVKLNAHSLESAATLIKLKLPLDVPATATGEVTAKAGLFSLSNLNAVVKDDNTVINATGSVQDLDTGHGIDFKLDASRLSIPEFGKLVDAEVNIKGVISGTASLVSDQKLFSLKNIDATVATDHAKAKVSGIVNDLTWGTGIKLDIDLQTDSLEEFEEYLGSNLLPLRQVDVKGRLENPGGVIGLYDISAVSRSKDANVSAQGDIEDLDTGENLQLKLNIDATSLSRFLGLVGSELAGASGVKLTGVLYKTDGVYGMREAKGEFGLESGTLQLAGSLANLDKRIGSNLRIKVDTDKLSRLSNWIGYKLPELGPVNLETNLSDANDIYDFKDFNLKLASSDLQGEIRIQEKNNRPPRISLNLKSQLLDYSVLFPEQNREEPPKRKIVFSKTPFNYDLLTEFNGDIKLAIDEYRTHNLVLTDLNLAAGVNEGAITVNPFSVKLNNGNLTGEVKFQYNKDSSTLDLELIGIQINAGDLKYFKKNNIMENGSATTAIKIKGKGKSSHEIASGLNGEMLVVIDDAQINNTVFELAGTDLLTEFIRKLNPFVKKSKVVEMECGVLHFKIKDGTASTNKGIAMQTKKVDIVGDGTINLETEKVEIAFFTKPREGIGISASTLAPVVRLGGTLADPKVEAYAEGFLKSSVNVGAAWYTGGLWLLAKGLFDRIISTAPVCKRAIQGPPPPKDLPDPDPEGEGDS